MRPPQYAPTPITLNLDLLTLKAVSESRVMWPICVQILLLQGFPVLHLRPMYVIDRRLTSDIQRDSMHHRLTPSRIGGVV